MQAIDPVEGIDQRLRRDRADAAFDVGHERADREELGRDRDAEAPVAGSRAMMDQVMFLREGGGAPPPSGGAAPRVRRNVFLRYRPAA